MTTVVTVSVFGLLGGLATVLVAWRLVGRPPVRLMEGTLLESDVRKWVAEVEAVRGELAILRELRDETQDEVRTLRAMVLGLRKEVATARRALARGQAQAVRGIGESGGRLRVVEEKVESSRSRREEVGSLSEERAVA